VLFGDISAHQPNAEIRLFGELAADRTPSATRRAIRCADPHRTSSARRDRRGLSQVSPGCVDVFNRAVSCLLTLGGQLILTGLSNADAHRLRSAGLPGAIRNAPCSLRSDCSSTVEESLRGHIYEAEALPRKNPLSRL